MGLGPGQSQASASQKISTQNTTPTSTPGTMRDWPTREDILKQGGPVQNDKEARKYLSQNGIALGENLDTNRLAEAMLRAASDNSARHGNYLRAFSLILESYREDRLVETMEEKLGAQMGEMGKLLTALETENAKLHETAEKMWMADENIRGIAKDVIEECVITTQAKLTRTGYNNEEHAPADSTEERNAPPTTYANAVRRNTANQAPRQTTLDKNKERGKRVIIDAKGDDIKALTEEALVAKGNMAIEMLSRVDYPSKPEGAAFTSVKKLRNGGMEFEMDSEESAEWIKSDEIRTKLADNFGNSAEIKVQGFTVLVKNAPLYFRLEEDGELDMVAAANKMNNGDITKAKWMKLPEKRHAKQTSAHIALTLKTVIAANEIIRYGITIRGKRCIVERLTREATRCNKCQRYGRHYAAQCQAIHDTCGTCGSIEHTTRGCEVGDNRQKHKCVNCNVTGHAAWSRDCPTLKKKNRELVEQSYEGGFKYFVTEDPNTWERIADAVEPQVEQRQQQRRGFQPATADWGYGHSTLPGSAPPPRATANQVRQQPRQQPMTQTSLHEWAAQGQQRTNEHRTWYDDADPIDMGGWDDPYPQEIVQNNGQHRTRQ
jgi:hypothetical protein